MYPLITFRNKVNIMDFENETKAVCLTYLRHKSEQSGDLPSLVSRCDEKLQSGIIADDTVLKSKQFIDFRLLKKVKL